MPKLSKSVNDFEREFGQLLEAERKLLKSFETGQECNIFDMKGYAGQHSDIHSPLAPGRPICATRTNVIRASLLRELSCEKLVDVVSHEKGIQIAGAWIDGDLDLSSCTVRRPLKIVDCTFERQPDLHGAALFDLCLDGSWLCRGLNANSTTFQGSLRFRDGFRSDGKVDLVFASIGGSLLCDRAFITNKDGYALVASQAKIKGSACFSGGFEASGVVDITNAIIEGQLILDGGKFCGNGEAAIDATRVAVTSDVLMSRGFFAEGVVQFRGARIGADLNCIGGRFRSKWTAIDLRSAEISDRLLIRQPNNADAADYDIPPTEIRGLLDLRNTRCRVLNDNALDGVSSDFRLRLDGFTYDQIEGPADFRKRKRWLMRQPASDLEDEFKPQPFEQLARVLRSAGHEPDAVRLAIFKSERLLRAGLLRAQNAPRRIARPKKATLSTIVKFYFTRFRRYLKIFFWAWPRFLGGRFLQVTLVLTYRPLLTVLFSIAIIVLGSFVFSRAYRVGIMVPNSALVLSSDAWVVCIDMVLDEVDYSSNVTECWLSKRQGEDFQRFNSLAYSLDVFLPLFDLHQESNWIPQPERTLRKDRLSRLARLYQWLHTCLGYLLTVVAVAGFTGVIKKE